MQLAAPAGAAPADEGRRRTNRAFAWATITTGAVASVAGFALWNAHGYPDSPSEVRLRGLGIGLLSAGALALPVGATVLTVESGHAEVLPRAGLALGVGLALAGGALVLMDGQLASCQTADAGAQVCFDRRDTRTAGFTVLGVAGAVTTAALVSMVIVERRATRVSLAVLPQGLALGGTF